MIIGRTENFLEAFEKKFRPKNVIFREISILILRPKSPNEFSKNDKNGFLPS